MLKTTNFENQNEWFKDLKNQTRLSGLELNPSKKIAMHDRDDTSFWIQLWILLIHIPIFKQTPKYLVTEL
jgi:hypothetical protein